jgi:hypothetical protein
MFTPTNNYGGDGIHCLGNILDLTVQNYHAHCSSDAVACYGGQPRIDWDTLPADARYTRGIDLRSNLLFKNFYIEGLPATYGLVNANVIRFQWSDQATVFKNVTLQNINITGMIRQGFAGAPSHCDKLTLTGLRVFPNRNGPSSQSYDTFFNLTGVTNAVVRNGRVRIGAGVEGVPLIAGALSNTVIENFVLIYTNNPGKADNCLFDPAGSSGRVLLCNIRQVRGDGVVDDVLAGRSPALVWCNNVNANVPLNSGNLPNLYQVPPLKTLANSILVYSMIRPAIYWVTNSAAPNGSFYCGPDGTIYFRSNNLWVTPTP